MARAVRERVWGNAVKIEVYVIGCAKCKRLERNLEQALRELGREDELIRLEDIEEIKRRGVMRAPVLFIDGEVKSVGIVPGVDELKAILTGE
ncbi:MAG: thioredoxin family protein [Methanomassiliicoccus sp.]|nr:thioredoxin family protein [Methanomassiliicoccus sp.]